MGGRNHAASEQMPSSQPDGQTRPVAQTIEALERQRVRIQAVIQYNQPLAKIPGRRQPPGGLQKPSAMWRRSTESSPSFGPNEAEPEQGGASLSSARVSRAA